MPEESHKGRCEDAADDGGVVHLRYTAQGTATGMAFFGPLGERTDAILSEYTADELSVIRRFITAAAASMHDHLESLDP